MCGRLNISDPHKLAQLLAEFNIRVTADVFHTNRFVRATNLVSIVYKRMQKPQVVSAIWWLLLDKSDSRFKPSKYTSFNTRSDKLNKRGTAGYQSYRLSRCIIPVNGFGETEFRDKRPLHYYDFQGKDRPLLMGGLYRSWIHPDTGVEQLSCSIITLPPHPRLKHLHSKSIPLILPHDQSVIDSWLDPDITNTNYLDSLLRATIPQDLIATPIAMPSNPISISASELIQSDRVGV